MFKARYRTYIILMMLLAFNSQLLAAAAMTCELEKALQPAALTPHMSNMDHSDSEMHMHHDMSHMDNDVDSTADHSKQIDNHHTSSCCKTMGHCLAGGCTLAMVSNDIVFALNKIEASIEDFYSGVTPQPLVSSPYRPPIS